MTERPHPDFLPIPRAVADDGTVIVHDQPPVMIRRVGPVAEVIDHGFDEPCSMEAVSEDEIDDGLTVLQQGLSQLLQGMEFSQVDRRRPGWSRKFKLIDIFLDWPTSDDGDVPKPSALVLCGEEDQVYEVETSPDYIEDTVDVYGRGTALRRLGSMRCSMMVVVWTVHKDERRAISKAFEGSFLAEPHQNIAGRRVVMRNYYNRTARFVFRSKSYADTPDTAHANEWVAVYRFDADIDIVRRVPYVEMVAPQATLAVEAP